MTAISSEESRSRPVAVRSALARDWEKRVGGGVSAAVATLVMAVRRASRPPAISLTQSFIERGRWLTEGEDSRIFSRVPFLFCGWGDVAGSLCVAGVWKAARMSASSPRPPARDFIFFTLPLGSGELRMGGGAGQSRGGGHRVFRAGGADGWGGGVGGAEFSARRREGVRSQRGG